MIVGTEWLIEAFDCDAQSLRELAVLQGVFARIIDDLGLKTLGESQWHKFGGEGGVTGLVMLTESHLACHTYPEYRTATFNLYCCRTRPEWNWEENLKEMLGATKINITKIERGKSNAGILPAVSDAARVRQENVLHVGRVQDSRQDACVTSSSNFPGLDFQRVNIHERGYLPHWEMENGIYFVTFRLADSLPKNVLDQVRDEREQYEKALTNLERELKPEEKRKMETLFSEKFDEFLDAGSGECYLKNPEIAGLVEKALKFYDEEKYRLFAWCVMPNHVHVLFQVFPHYSLSEITHSWKSYTAHEANKILSVSGKFWQRESYDRLVRSEHVFYEIVEYILNNPAKANLQNWRWVGIKNISENRLQLFRQAAGFSVG
jgi:S-adenosylmethionine decarboxylase proenzyme